MSFSYPHWDQFQDQAVAKILGGGGKVVDISGGLRIKRGTGNNYSETLAARYLPMIKNGTELIVTDYTDKYHPDETQDIHNLTYADNSIDGIFCMAVMEHIQHPEKAANEIVRVLKPGGKALIYVPFIYRYHVAPGEFGDFFRYTRDGLNFLFRNCSKIEIVNVYGILESLLKLTPLSQVKILRYIARFLDENVKKLRETSKYQTSGFNVFIQK